MNLTTAAHKVRLLFERNADQSDTFHGVLSEEDSKALKLLCTHAKESAETPLKREMERGTT